MFAPHKLGVIAIMIIIYLISENVNMNIKKYTTYCVFMAISAILKQQYHKYIQNYIDIFRYCLDINTWLFHQLDSIK